MRHLGADWDTRGIKINGEVLTHLRFADDVVVLMSNDVLKLVQNAKEFLNICKEAGLKVNTTKTKLLSNSAEVDVMLNNTKTEWVDEIKYLGQIISFKCAREKELSNRIKNGWNKFWSLKHIFKNKLPTPNKAEVWRSCVQSALTYGAQKWALTRSNMNRLQVTQRSMERSMLNLKIKQKIEIWGSDPKQG